MTKNTQRLSQLISTYGPGAMVDLTTRSVVVGGLELWEAQGDALSEPRLQTQLERILKNEGRIGADEFLTLRLPPVSSNRMGELPKGISTPVFPAWFVSEKSDAVTGSTSRRRRLVEWKQLETKGKRTADLEGLGKSDVTPIRFVCACDKGHLQDINWHWVVHGGQETCKESLWLEETGTSGAPADTRVTCGCGKSISLQDAFQPGRLGYCKGLRPWLLDRDPNGCNNQLRLLTRTATNTYFPQVLRVVSIPTENDELTQLIEELMSELGSVASAAEVDTARKFNTKVRAVLEGISSEDVFNSVEKIRNATQLTLGSNLRMAEFDVLASGAATIGANGHDSRLFAKTIARNDWQSGGSSDFTSSIEKLVEVHRLREVSCLYGFTRFEPLPSIAELDLDEIQVDVLGAPIARNSTWLPAVELFGEGFFIEFNSQRVEEWANRAIVLQREDQMRSAYLTSDLSKASPFPGIKYVLMHSIAHALMTEVALDCGYPANSLKERVYVHSIDGAVGRYGLLIYTANPGAQGTLGGLVAITKRIPQILEAAVGGLNLCSNDPICADHDPDAHSGDRVTHGAACHGCLLISETSCENRNRYIDRSLLAETLANRNLEFFDIR